MASSTITRKTDVAVYDLNIEGLRSVAHRVKTHILRIQCSSEDAVPKHVKLEFTESRRGVITNGNGACAIHAVFGKPNVAQQVFAWDARDLAVHFLSTLPDAANVSAEVARSCQIIQTSLWNEFAKPHICNTGSTEAKLFWNVLERRDPALAAEAKNTVEAGNMDTHDADKACREAVVCSHTFFTVASEELFVRPLAIRLGYLGADVEVSVDIGVDCVYWSQYVKRRMAMKLSNQ